MTSEIKKTVTGLVTLTHPGVFLAKAERLDQNVKNTLNGVLQDLRGEHRGKVAMTDEHYQTMYNVMMRSIEGQLAEELAEKLACSKIEYKIKKSAKKALPSPQELNEFKTTQMFLRKKAGFTDLQGHIGFPKNFPKEILHNDPLKTRTFVLPLSPIGWLRQYAKELIEADVLAKNLGILNIEMTQKIIDADNGLSDDQKDSIWELVEQEASQTISQKDVEKRLAEAAAASDDIDEETARLQLYFEQVGLGEKGLAGIVKTFADKLESQSRETRKLQLEQFRHEEKIRSGELMHNEILELGNHIIQQLDSISIVENFNDYSIN